MHRSKDSHQQSARSNGTRSIGERLLAGEVNSSPRPGKRRRLSRMAMEANAPAPGSDASDDRNIRYAELHCHSSYSFMEGASHTSELVIRAKELGLEALALTDHDNLCGAME
ncbi:MAG: PHP domain-containing protein, partial [Chloroflexota bacterium]